MAQDGAQHNDLVLDLMATVCKGKGIDLPDPFHLEVPCKNPIILKKDSKVAAIIFYTRGDCVHILCCKGVLGHLICSIMSYLCWHDGPGKKQAVAPEKRLGAMFEAIQKEYGRQASHQPGSPTSG